MAADPDALPRSRLAVACRRAALRGAVVGGPLLLVGAPLAAEPRPLLSAGMALAVASAAASLPLLLADPLRPLMLRRMAVAWLAAAGVLGAALGGAGGAVGRLDEAAACVVAGLLGATPFAVAATCMLDEVVHMRAMRAGDPHPEPWTPVLLYCGLAAAGVALVGVPVIVGGLLLAAAWYLADGLDRRAFAEDAWTLDPAPGPWATPVRGRRA